MTRLRSTPSPLPPAAAQDSLVKEIAPLSVDVLIEGETGTGKDVTAREIHRHSGRCGKFIAINCAAVPEHIAESELFGYESGAFTGAARAKEGKLELAHDGTLYLDEIDSMPLAIQAKLLRALQERGCERLGGSRFYRSDFRVVASTKIALLQLVEQGCFRKDLYYRLNVVKLRLPSLRDSREKVLPLFGQFLDEACQRHGRSLPAIPGGSQKLLMEYPWPGNIRELKNAAERFALGLAPLGDEDQGEVAPPPGMEAPPRADDSSLSLRERVRNFEQDVIASTLARHDQVVARAAQELQISVNTLYYRIKTLGVRIAAPAAQAAALPPSPQGETPATPEEALSALPLAQLPAALRAALKHRFTATFRLLAESHPARAQHLIFPDHDFLGALLDALARHGEAVDSATLAEQDLDGAVAAVREASEEFCRELRQPSDDFLQNMRNSQAADRYAKSAERALHNFRPRIGDTSRLWQELAELPPCSGLAASQLWRLCIDPLKLELMQAKGLQIGGNPYIGHLFDSEPSYLYHMARAWLAAMRQLEQPLDLAFVLRLHALCSGADDDVPASLPAASGAWAQFVLLPGETLSSDGEEELARFVGQQAAALRCSLSAKRLNGGGEFKIFKREEAAPPVLAGLMREWIGAYHSALASAADAELRLGAAIALCQKLQRLRPFPTGNCRTFGILLLNRLLVQQGQSLAMLDNPNKLDGFSAAEILALVYQGQRRVAGWRGDALPAAA
ncbi:sigma 54-interacting transcriptional regulator [Massilia sp. BJB1822]|uniref:sigma 54-interacting transcriptional regulator n=1 Tax=Massilia sp. BJB1822 TaxID=2744470 RepID=UPI0015948E71|nr:sigma-54 dependent transcriptional regulator [Massilia sp. BJB1822]NVE00152.1 sigma-54-dependent Fis family transcriptional regulator [Massilia sp. BJB1822]